MRRLILKQSCPLRINCIEKLPATCPAISKGGFDLQNLLPILLLIFLNSGCLNTDNFSRCNSLSNNSCGCNGFNDNCRENSLLGNSCLGNGFWGDNCCKNRFLGNDCCGNNCRGNSFCSNNCGCNVPNRSSCYFRPHCNNWRW